MPRTDHLTTKSFPNMHKLPCIVTTLITEMNTGNIIGFGRTKPQQLDNLINSYIKKKSVTYQQCFTQELAAYHAQLKQRLTLTKAG